MMDDVMEQLGTIKKSNGKYEAKLERFVDHDQATVWSMLTESDKLVKWLAPGSLDPQKGGAAKLDFGDSGIVIDSVVSEFDPPTLIEYSWSSPGEPQRPVRWKTSPNDQGSKLSLILTIPDNEDIARACAGWEAHLMMLLAALEGVPIKFPFERFQSTRIAYNEMVQRFET